LKRDVVLNKKKQTIQIFESGIFSIIRSTLFLKSVNSRAQSRKPKEEAEFRAD
jgi:hypothetical protein